MSTESHDGPDDLALVGEAKYYPGRTTLSAKPARLEWSNDGRIRLITMDKKTGEDVEQVFDVPASELRAKRFPTSPSLYVLTVAGKKHKIDFASKANYAAGIGAGIGRVASQRIVDRSDLPAWVAAFEQAGILD